jgi:hypothetical protein
VAIDPKNGASLAAAGGVMASVPMAELIAVEWPAGPWKDEAAPATVLLHDGGRLAGSIGGGGEDRLDFEVPGAGPIPVPVDLIRAVLVGARASRFDRSRFAGFTDSDAIFRRPEVGGDFARGTLAAFTADAVRFDYSLGTGSFPWDEIEALVLQAQIEVPPPGEPVVRAALRQDGSLKGRLVRLTEQELVLEPAGFGVEIALPRSTLQSLSFEGPSHAWLSDLEPAVVEQVPFLGPPSEFLFPWRVDRSVTGRPLSVGGRRYDRGFGCHSRTTLRFALDGGFTRFVAEVGVSDEVRDLGDAGAIEFRVEIDGETRFTSRVLRAGDAPVQVGPLPIEGARTLALVTDFGDGEDVADRGAWGSPLLFR